VHDREPIPIRSSSPGFQVGIIECRVCALNEYGTCCVKHVVIRSKRTVWLCNKHRTTASLVREDVVANGQIVKIACIEVCCYVGTSACCAEHIHTIVIVAAFDDVGSIDTISSRVAGAKCNHVVQSLMAWRRVNIDTIELTAVSGNACHCVSSERLWQAEGGVGVI